MGDTYAFTNYRINITNKLIDISESEGRGPIYQNQLRRLRAFAVDHYEARTAVDETARLAWETFF